MQSPTRGLVNSAKVDMLTTKNNDMKQRRVVNAAPAIDTNDYITKGQVDQSVSDLQTQIGNIARNLKTTAITTTIIKPPVDSTTAIQVTQANGQVPVMTIDTVNSMVGFDVSVRYVATSSALPTSGNTAGDFYVAQDTNHLWVWTGSAWSDVGVANLPLGPACKVDVLGSIVTRGVDSTIPQGVGFGRFSFDVVNNICDLVTYNTRTSAFQQLMIRGDPLILGVTGGRMAFYGALPAAKQNLSGYSPQVLGTFAGIATGAPGVPYAQVNDLNTVRNAVENLRLAVEDLRTKLQSSTIVG